MVVEPAELLPVQVQLGQDAIHCSHLLFEARVADIDDVKKQVEVLKAAGLNINWREFDKGHTIAGEEELSVIRDFARAAFKV